MINMLTKSEWAIYLFSGLLIFGLMRYIPHAVSTSATVITADIQNLLIEHSESIKDRDAFVAAIWIERIALPLVAILALCSIAAYFFRSYLFPNAIISTYLSILVIVSIDHGMSQIWQGKTFFNGYIQNRDVLKSLITTFAWGPVFLIPFVRKTFKKIKKEDKREAGECPAE